MATSSLGSPNDGRGADWPASGLDDTATDRRSASLCQEKSPTPLGRRCKHASRPQKRHSTPRGEVLLILIFLLSIVMLPVTNGLYGVYRLDSVVAASYGFHLTVIAGLNALL